MFSINQLVKVWKESSIEVKFDDFGEVFHIKDPSLEKFFINRGESKYLFTGEKIFKDSRTAYACISSFGGRRLFFKQMHHRNRPAYHLFRYILFPSRGYVNAVISEVLRRSGIPTPEVFVCGERLENMLLHTSYLISDAVNAENLSIAIPYVCRDICVVKAFLMRWGSLIKKMHSAGVYHSDAKTSNFYIVSDNRDLSDASVWTEVPDLIGVWDLDGAKFYRDGVPVKLKIRDAARAFSSFLIDAERCGVADALSKYGIGPLMDCFCSHAEVDKNLLMKEINGRWSKQLTRFEL